MSGYDAPDGTLRLSSRTYQVPSLAWTRSMPDMWLYMPLGGTMPSHSFRYPEDVKTNSSGTMPSLMMRFSP